jgi:photosystem II Psb28-2 protein
MQNTIPTIEFFDGISEELENVSLRRNPSTGLRSVKFTFQTLKALQQGNSFIKRSFNTMQLIDSEGTISVAPTSTKLFWGGEENDELKRFEFVFEIDYRSDRLRQRDEHWERFMGFMGRYSTAHDLTFAESSATAALEVEP